MKMVLPAALVCACLSAQGQQTPVFRSGADVVRVDVLVSDRGRPVIGLTATDFEVFDNGVRQTVRLVDQGQLPLAVTLVLDTSGSLAGPRLGHLVDASSVLLDALHPDDVVSLIVFDDRVRLVATDVDAAQVRTELRAVVASGRTCLHDAAYAALITARPAEGRRLVLLFSDGVDTESWLGRDAVVRASGRTDAVVYGVDLRDRVRDYRESDTTRGVLEALPDATGGRVIHADGDKGLSSAFRAVIEEFRQRYWLAYAPEGVSRGDGWHTLKVKVRNRNVSVTARRGYLPAERLE